ncbi:MAG: TOMM precursor leader peptide-binding protein [Coxiellaceae bacterium]|nr:TOMM precursor leader peptide-binding protein [Coxiellaceae bacterium]
MSNPRIKSFYSVIAHSASCVELRSGAWSATSHVLNDDEDSNLLSMIQLLTGEYSAIEIAVKLGCDVAAVDDVVSTLESLDIVEYEPSSALQLYLSHFDKTINRYGNEQAQQLPVVLVGHNEISAEIERIFSKEKSCETIQLSYCDSELYAYLNTMDETAFHDGLEYEKLLMRFESWRHSLIVFTQPTVNPAHCQYLNKICFDLNIPWMNIAIDGPFLFIGPVFSSKAPPCYQCFETRLLMNIKMQESYLRYKKAMASGLVTSPTQPLHHIVTSLLAAHAASDIINYSLTQSAFTLNKVLSIYMPTMEFQFNEVLPLAGCETCGSIAGRDDNQLYFDLQALIEEP